MRVLIVEDEMMVAMLLEDMLSDLGHTVVGIASQIDAAMNSARHAEIDLAVLDLNLNGQQSLPVAEILRARNIPFLFATGYGEGVLQGNFKEALALQKPFVGDQLKNAINSIPRAAAVD
ncbi:MAG TPA: response regulator [Candidatus Limnocylindria bacterium]|nr:response regulator [Candidatus Limnocylindria bacterium]